MSVYSEIRPEIRVLAQQCVENSRIDPELYTKYDVKRGLRDLNGKGVLTGLTNISEIVSTKTVEGKSVPCEGKLYYRGYDVEELVRRQPKDDNFGFERTAYLLLLGELPGEEQLKEFCGLLSFYRTLPTSFVRDIIMKAPSGDMMNTLARSVLTLYSYDEDAEDISVPNVLRQCMQLVALFPLLSVYGYQAYRHYHDGQSLFIHQPDPKLSVGEHPAHSAPRLPVHPAGGQGAGHCPHPPRGPRRRQQLHLHHPCGHLLRHGYILGHRGGPGLPKGPQAWRRQH